MELADFDDLLTEFSTLLFLNTILNSWNVYALAILVSLVMLTNLYYNCIYSAAVHKFYFTNFHALELTFSKTFYIIETYF